MAGGSWTTKHVVTDLPSEQRAAYAQFFRSPCMIVNVALRNWRFLYKRGHLGSFLVRRVGYLRIGPQVSHLLYRGQDHRSGLARSDDHQGPILPSRSAVGGAAKCGARRTALHFLPAITSGGYASNSRRCSPQPASTPSGDIAGIVLNRWGHAYCSPQPGFFFGQNGQPAPREILRRAPFGRIAFANTDLSGDPGHATAIEEGQRAAAQLLDRLH